LDESLTYKRFEEITDQDQRYSLRAYFFILAAVDYCLSKLPERKHISGSELCEGAREYGIMMFGPMVLFVLHSWGIRSTRDIGEIVYLLISKNMLSKSPDDNIEDFEHVYDFIEAFKEVTKPLPSNFCLEFSYEDEISVKGRTFHM
jgi:uncharacterized repeat protein (TIGR04138 family)